VRSGGVSSAPSATGSRPPARIDQLEERQFETLFENGIVDEQAAGSTTSGPPPRPGARRNPFDGFHRRE